MVTNFKKKGEIGVGTLIIFIAGLIVCALAAGVLISTSNSLQQKSFKTGDESESKISTNLNVISITATDGGNELTEFEEIMKLSPGSDSINLGDMLLTFTTDDTTAILNYRGENSICSKNNQNGYNTHSAEELDAVDTSTVITLEEDLDDDSLDDILYLTDTYLYINLSREGLFNISLGVNLSNASGTPQTLSITNSQLNNGSVVFGDVTIQGTTDVNSTIVESVTFTVTPKNIYRGYFSAIYENQGDLYREGSIQQGDVLRLCFESPRPILEDEFVRLNIIPKVGSTTMSQFYTAQAISDFRVFLYP
jgi:archaellin